MWKHQVLHYHWIAKKITYLLKVFAMKCDLFFNQVNYWVYPQILQYWYCAWWQWKHSAISPKALLDHIKSLLPRLFLTKESIGLSNNRLAWRGLGLLQYYPGKVLEAKKNILIGCWAFFWVPICRDNKKYPQLQEPSKHFQSNQIIYCNYINQWKTKAKVLFSHLIQWEGILWLCCLLPDI